MNQHNPSTQLSQALHREANNFRETLENPQPPTIIGLHWYPIYFPDDRVSSVEVKDRMRAEENDGAYADDDQDD